MTLTPEAWKRVRALFDEALGVEAAARDEWLRERCEDEAVRAEVRSLLRHDSGPGAIEEAVSGAAREARADAAPSRIGTTIGRYRIVGRIGEGGMGTVWLAERTDGAFDKRVAIKVVRGGLDSARLVERFRNERRLLARLEHPGIARILDGGETADGLPYFVLEFVEGAPPDAYARERALPLAAIVDLMLQVCDAVEYAHRRLVLHRDLKPANILVAKDGRARLLDFGIGKLLAGEDDAGLTEAAGRAMTPEYAAPEQVRGEAVSTATDVYALGAVLYELIAGASPFGAPGVSRLELEMAVLERDPEPPSRRGAVRARNAGELDDVVLRALRKEPAERYATVAALADDLRRWRSGRPVAARPPTFAYRAGKFLRRHRVGVAVGAAAILALVAGTAGLATGLVRAKRAEEEARREAATSERVVDFLVGLFRHSDPERAGGTMTARELLDEGAASVALLEEEPLVMARLLGTMGIAYSELGLYGNAREHFERALAAREADPAAADADVAESLNNLANVEKILGLWDDATAHYERAVAIKGRLHGADSPEVARTLYGLAGVRAMRGDAEGARDAYERLLAIQDGPEGAEAADVANTCNALAGVLMQTGDLEGAATRLGRAIDLLSGELGPRHPRVIGMRTNLAFLALERGDAAAARDLCEETLPALEELRGPEHPHVAATLNALGKARQALGDGDGARAALERSLRIWEKAVGPGNPQVADALADVAAARETAGDAAGARQAIGRALAIRETALGADHPLTTEARDRLAAFGAAD